MTEKIVKRFQKIEDLIINLKLKKMIDYPMRSISDTKSLVQP